MTPRRISEELPQPFSLDYSESEHEARIVMRGELDRLVAERFSRALRDAELSAAERIVIEASALTFIDSAGLALVLQAARRAGAQRRTLVVENPSQPVQRLLELAAMTHLIANG